MRPTIRPLLIALLAAQALPALAARPMTTDDARLTDAQACQLETWLHLHGSQQEWWALPACNPGGNLEITAGGALAWASGEPQSGAQVLQMKTLFKPLETNGWGIGLAAGYAIQPGDTRSGSPYFYVPTSFSLADDRLVIHTNIGYASERENKDNRLTWGLGSEIQVTPRLYVIAETYGQDKGSAFFQAGLRYWLMPNRLQIDTTYGNQFDHLSDKSWLSIGLRIITPTLF
ncbi:MAG: hypothetical protein WAV95_07700 [Azonexus sp.]